MAAITTAGAASLADGRACPPLHGGDGTGPIFGLLSPLLDMKEAASLSLRLRPDGDLFVIEALDHGGLRLMTLGVFEEEEVVAVWRALNARIGLPLVIEHADGSREAPYPQLGRLLLGPTRTRRRHGLLRDRRPRFLVRRKTGRLPLRPAVHGGREIVAGARR